MGELCRILLPIPEESYLGNPDSSVAVCTLSSMDLLKKFANSEILDHISIAGRLLSENKGIDSIIKHVYNNRKIKTILVCGKDAWGHRAGHSLFALHENGVDKNNRINSSTSPEPYLAVSRAMIDHFQNNVTLVNLVNEENFETITKKIGN